MSRQPNGYGSCHKIGGKKRNKPYRVRVTDGWAWDEEKGKAIQKFRTIGYFETRKEGLIALAEYNKNPAKKGTADITYADLYKMWLEYKKPQGQSLRGYTTSYGYCAPLYSKKIKDIKTEHLEDVMNNLTVGVAAQKALKTLWNQTFDFAVSRDFIPKNYSKHVTTKDRGSNTTNREPFTKEEVQLLWDNVDKVEGIDTALILIYTGMRPSELLGIRQENVHLEERYMIGGIKTEAGKNRAIPIHEKIVPFIEQRMKNKSDWLVCNLSGRKMSYPNYMRTVWDPIREKCNLTHTPHECRHTGISLMTIAGIDDRILKKIVGHSTGDITQRYTHADIETLVNAINQVE